MFVFEFFVIYLMAPLVLIFGWVCNSLGMIVLSKKKLKKIGLIHTYRYLLIIDSIYLTMIFQPYLAHSFKIDLMLYSNEVLNKFQTK